MNQSLFKKILISAIVAFIGVNILSFLDTESLALRGDRRDHISQLSSSLVIECVGFDLFRKAPSELFEPDRSAETIAWGKQYGIPDYELFKLPQCTTKPISVVWTHFPRPYGPGIYLLLKPIAMLWDHDWISFRTAQLFVFYTMIFFGVLASILFATILQNSSLKLPKWFVNSLILFFTLDSLRWAMNGQFDSISIFILLLGFLFFQRNAFEKSLFFFSMSFFFQFRTLFWVPVILYTMLKLYQNFKKPQNSFKINSLIWLLGTMIIGIIGLYVFYIAYKPVQAEMITHITNPLFLGGGFKVKEWLGISFICGISIYLLIKNHFILSGTQLFWLLFLLAQMPYVLGMHGLFVFPLVLVPFIDQLSPSITEKNMRRTIMSVGLSYLILAGTVFTNSPLDFNILQEIVRAYNTKP